MPSGVSAKTVSTKSPTFISGDIVKTISQFPPGFKVPSEVLTVNQSGNPVMSKAFSFEPILLRLTVCFVGVPMIAVVDTSGADQLIGLRLTLKACRTVSPILP